MACQQRTIHQQFQRLGGKGLQRIGGRDFVGMLGKKGNEGKVDYD